MIRVEFGRPVIRVEVGQALKAGGTSDPTMAGR